jgi:hypothetical protein
MALTCPECGVDVPSTGMSGRVGMGPDMSVGQGPQRSHTRCPSCGIPLVRLVEPPEGVSDGWERNPNLPDSDPSN